MIASPANSYFYVTENGNKGNAQVGEVSASDEDGDEVVFALQGPNSLFTIDSKTGVISVLKSLDFEAQSVYSLVIIATEADTGRAHRLADTHVFSVQVVNVNEPPVVVDSANRTVPENSPVGDLAGRPLSVADPDARTVLSFTARANEQFGIISGDGQIFVSGALDFEAQNHHELLVTATDAGGLASVEAVVSVQVLDVNEPPSIVARSLQNTGTNATAAAAAGAVTTRIKEDAEQGTAIAIAIASDNETPIDALSYFLVEDGGRQGSDMFSVTKTTEGATVQLSSDSLDYETQQSYSLHLCAADDGKVADGATTEPLSTCMHVVIAVEDVPDMTIEYFGGDIPHATTGGDRVFIYGSNFGFGSPDTENAPLVVTYSNDIDSPAASSIIFTAKDCFIAPDGNTKITCLTVPGAGDKLRWTVQIGELSVSSPPTVTTSYKRPNITAVELTPQLIPTEGRTSVTLTGSNFGPLALGNSVRQVFLSISYGGESGDIYSAAACRMIQEHTMVTCATTEGVGSGHNWAMTVEGLRSPIARVGSAYKTPVVDRIEGAVNMSTTGGEIIYLIGSNFGPATTPTAIKSGVTTTVLVEYGLFDQDNTTTQFVAADCSVRIAHFQIMCTTIPGVGRGLRWRVTLGEQTGAPSLVTTSYRPPVVTSVTGPGTQGGSTMGGQEVIISGFGFVPGVSISVMYGRKQTAPKQHALESATAYRAKNCVVVVEHFSLRCYTAEGTGKDHAWQVDVEGLGSSSLFSANTSYAPPVIAEITGAGASLADTAGGQAIHLHGANFGPMREENVVTARYGVLGSNALYEARECSVTAPHKMISCTTVAGVGKPLFWSVLVDGQNSTVPTTSYARPEIHNISLLDPNIDDNAATVADIAKAATTGGQLLIIQGAYFGAIGSNDIKSVSYGAMGRTYVARNCAVLSNIPSTEARMQCSTVPGVGRNLRFLVNIGGQESAIVNTKRSAATLSYADPVIKWITPAVSDTADAITVTIKGANFGPPGSTLVGTTFGYQFSDPFGDDAVRDGVATSSNIVATKHRSDSVVEFVVPAGTVDAEHLVQIHVTSIVASSQDRTNGVNKTSSVGSNTVLFSITPPKLATVRLLDPKNIYSSVVIFGSSFGRSNETGKLLLAGRSVPVVSWGHSKIVCSPIAMSGDLQLVVGTQRSNVLVNFAPTLLMLNPIVTRVFPQVGPTEGGINVTIEGSRFGDPTQGSVVMFGNVPCTDIVSFTPTKIVCKLPAGSGDVLINVNNGWQRSSSRSEAVVTFAYDYPVIESISPARTMSTAAIGEVITLTGFNFAPVVEDNTLLVGGNVVTIDSASPKRIVFRAPAGLGGDAVVTLTVGRGTSKSILLKRPMASVYAISPQIVPTKGGDTVQIAGSNFGISPRVTIGGRDCTNVQVLHPETHTNLSCMMPEGAGEQNMAVHVHTGEMGDDFTVAYSELGISYASPSIRQITGKLGSTQGGEVLEVTGTNFGFTSNLSFSLMPAKVARNSRRLLAFEIQVCAMQVLESNHSFAKIVVPPCYGQRLTVGVATPFQSGGPVESFSPLAFDLPTLSYASPVPANANGDTVYVHGFNLGGIDHDVMVRLDGIDCANSRWLPFDPSLGNKSATRTDAGSANISKNLTRKNLNLPVIACDIGPNQKVGYRNVAVDVAGTTNSVNDSLLLNAPLVSLLCPYGYYGEQGETCKICPVGAVCDGGLARPRAQQGWWGLNESRYVRCLPSHACLGNNTCEIGYGGGNAREASIMGENATSFGEREGEEEEGAFAGGYPMCSKCEPGYYRAQQDCDKCDAESSAIFTLSIIVVCFFFVAVLGLTRYDFKLASVTVLVDFMQTVAILGHMQLPWPSSLRGMFKVASVFIFNFQIAAPECYAPGTWRYDYLWYIIQCLPILCMVVLTACYCVDRCLNGVRQCTHRRKRRVIHVNQITPAQMRGLKAMRTAKAAKMAEMRSPAEHLHSITGAGSVIVLYLYFALVSTAVQVHQCAFLDDNLSVLIAEPSEPCKITYSLAAIKEMGFAGTQAFYGVVFPLSIVSLIVYGIGIPLGYHMIFYTHREAIVLDLWRRARGKDVEGTTHRMVPAAMKIQKVWRAYKLRNASGLGGYFVSKNPKKIAYLDVRRLFGKVYEDFSPNHSNWRLLQLWRKLLICAAVVGFSHSAVLTAGLVSILLTLAFALQMHVKPFMYSRKIFSTEHQSDHKVRNRNTIAHTKEMAQIRAKAQYHCETSLQGKRSINRHLKIVAKQDRLASDLNKLTEANYAVRISRGTETVIEFLMDFNSLEAMNLLFCSIMLNVGVIFEGLRALEINSHGNSFMGVIIAGSNGDTDVLPEESAGILSDDAWNTFFVRALEIFVWFMFVFFVFVCIASVVVDVVRNCLYHTYDMIRVHKIMSIQKENQKKALETYHQNVLDAHSETVELKTEMGRLQDLDAKRLSGQTKDFEKKKNAIEREIAEASLNKLKLNQKLRKLRKKQPKMIERGGGDLPPLIDVSSLNNDDEIERCMREFDEALKTRADPAALAARARMERRLRLRKAQIKKRNIEAASAAELADVDERLRQQMDRDMTAVAAADADEDAALQGMSDEDVEKMLEKLLREAREGVPDGNREKSKERLRKKLERRQQKKMLRERAALKIAQLEAESGAADSAESLTAKEAVSRDLEAEIARLDKQAGEDRSRFAQQFQDDHAQQSLRLREKLRRKHQKKLEKFQKKTLEKLESAVQADDSAVADMGEGNHSLMLQLQAEIARLDEQTLNGQVSHVVCLLFFRFVHSYCTEMRTTDNK